MDSKKEKLILTTSNCEYISIDDQIIGFQGRHSDKLHVIDKSMGDEFQVIQYVQMDIILTGSSGTNLHYHATLTKVSLPLLQDF